MLAARRLRHGPPCFPGGPSPPEPPTYDGCRSCACAAPRPPRNPPRTTVAVRALVLLRGLPGTPPLGGLPLARLCCPQASPEPPPYDGCRGAACAAASARRP